MCSDVSSLTRRQLYDLVWRKPVQAVAKEFGISDRGLGKLCERHGIPVPPRGYWARKASGQKIPRPPLIDVQGSSSPDQGVILAKSIPVPQTNDDRQRLDDELKTLWTKQVEETLAPRVPKSMTNPHAHVARVLDERKAQASRWSLLPSPYSPRSTGLSSLERRQLRIVDAIFKCFVANGFTTELDSRTFDVTIRHLRNDAVRFSIGEHIRQYRRQLTEEERATRWSSKQTWTQEKEATGRLVLKIENYIPAKIPLVFHDTEEDPLEGKLREVVSSIGVVLAYERMRREESELADRRRYEAIERARKLEEQRKAEQAKKDDLRKDAALWKEAAILREYVAAVRIAAEAGRQVKVDGDIERWADWALAHANEIDPIAEG